jgi:hypothetical protein
VAVGVFEPVHVHDEVNPPGPANELVLVKLKLFVKIHCPASSMSKFALGVGFTWMVIEFEQVPFEAV